jgi:hypothetical protein
VTLAKLYPKRAPLEEELGNRKPGPNFSAIAEKLLDLAARRAGFKRYFRGFGPEPVGRPPSLPSDLIGMDSAAEIDFSGRRF